MHNSTDVSEEHRKAAHENIRHYFTTGSISDWFHYQQNVDRVDADEMAGYVVNNLPKWVRAGMKNDMGNIVSEFHDNYLNKIKQLGASDEQEHRFTESRVEQFIEYLTTNYLPNGPKVVALDGCAKSDCIGN